MIQFKPIEQHIENRSCTRLCDGKPVGPADISSEDWFELRDARKDATLCPDCQDKVPPRNVLSDIYGYGRRTTAHLYAVPVLAGFDAIRNCSHCRRNSSDDNCKAWREARKSMAVLRQQCRRYAKGVDELLAATGGRTANIYQFADGSVAYFAPDAPDFKEAGELKDEELAAAQRILAERGVPGAIVGDIHPQRSQARPACPFRRREVYVPLAQIKALYGDCAKAVFLDSARNARFPR